MYNIGFHSADELLPTSSRPGQMEMLKLHGGDLAPRGRIMQQGLLAERRGLDFSVGDARSCRRCDQKTSGADADEFMSTIRGN